MGVRVSFFFYATENKGGGSICMSYRRSLSASYTRVLIVRELRRFFSRRRENGIRGPRRNGKLQQEREGLSLSLSPLCPPTPVSFPRSFWFYDYESRELLTRVSEVTSRYTALDEKEKESRIAERTGADSQSVSFMCAYCEKNSGKGTAQRSCKNHKYFFLGVSLKSEKYCS